MSAENISPLILALSGRTRSPERLSELLGITRATAYQWMRRAETEPFRATDTVRGPENRLAKDVLLNAAERIAKNELRMDELEQFVAGEIRSASSPGEALTPRGVTDNEPSDAALREILHRLTGHLQRQLRDPNVTPREILIQVRGFVEMMDG